MLHLRILICVVLSLTSLHSLAHLPQTWDIEREVPPITYIGTVTEEEQQIGDAFRTSMIEMLRYWRDLGLPDPPDLEGFYYLSSEREVRLSQVLEILNPSIPNIREHVAQQYEAFENSHILRSFLKNFVKIAPKKYKDRGPKITRWLFNLYALTRYGYSTGNFLRDLKNDVRLADIHQSEWNLMPQADNAFYGRFPKLDLTTLLKPENPNKTFGQSKPEDFIDLSYMGEVTENMHHGYSRRIVILPRTTQMRGESVLSTLRDPTVGKHELGHHMNATLAHPGTVLHRAIDEVFADYFTAAQDGNPKIGEAFAEASGEISRRLQDKPGKTKQEVQLLHALARLAEKGVIRNMEQEADIDSLDRVYKIADDYSVGGPIRKFLWDLRHTEGVDPLRFDRLMIAAIPDLSALPAMMSTTTQMKLFLRKLWLEMRSTARRRWIVSQIPKPPLTKAELDRFVDEAVDAATEEFFEGDMTAEKLAARRDEVKARATEIKNELINENGVRDNGFVPIVEAEIRLRKLREQQEARAKKRRRFAHRLGLSNRERTTADYVLPEFFRSLYRTAQKEAPDLLPLIRKGAERAMNSSTFEVVTRSGSKELVFVRTRFGHAISRKVALAKLEKMEELRGELQALRDRKSTMNRKEFDDLKKPIVKAYHRRLDAIQEYERTGSLMQLFFPNWGTRVTTGFFAKCSKLFSKNKSDETEDEKKADLAKP